MTEFLHHGIEGQKWGVQNGPPYPLDKAEAKKIRNRAAREASSQYKKYLKDVGKEITNSKARKKEISAQSRQQADELLKKFYDAQVQYIYASKGIEKAQKFVNKNKSVMVTAYNQKFVYSPDKGVRNYVTV